MAAGFYNGPMVVVVNGQQRELPEPLTLAALVELLALSPQRIAVECNQRLVTRSRYADTPLRHGDVVEIVTLVGGG